MVPTNPNKPGKVRLIWDAAAKAHGTSLNDMLLKGPDELSSLLGVLFRFRLYAVAACADVKEMFLQIMIRKEDKHAQRFLWRYEPTDELETYIMDVVTFGSACSPATAQYVKNRNAREHMEQFPRAVEGIIETEQGSLLPTSPCCPTSIELQYEAASGLQRNRQGYNILLKRVALSCV